MQADDKLFDQTPPSGRTATGGFLAGTMVFTAHGMMPVEYLAAGDRIVTRTGLLPLVAMTTRRRARATLVRIKASTQSVMVPARDLLLCPDQMVLIRDWRAQILHGRAVAAVPAGRLVDGEYVVTEKRRDAWFFSPAFEADAVIYTEGQETALAGLTHPGFCLTA